jgi:small-conductance mechanosensitive channel
MLNLLGLDILSNNDIISTLTGNEYLASLIIFSIFVVFGAIFHFILKRLFNKITARTKTDLDDKIFGIISMPIFIMINLVGVYLSIQKLSFLKQFADLIDNVFFVLYVIIISFTTGRVIALIFSKIITSQTGMDKAPGLLVKIINSIILVIALLIILDRFGVDVTAAAAALGLAGIAVGLALQGTLTNFFSGLHIITDRPLKVGDFIEIDGTEIRGFVEDISWRSTRIRTWQDNIVIIPNNKLAESVITNVEMPQNESNIRVECGVGYGSDLTKVESVTLDVAREVQNSVKGAVKGFEPIMRFTKFGDSNIEFFVMLRISDFAERFTVKHEFIKALKARFDKEGIEISWPVRKIYYAKEDKK